MKLSTPNSQGGFSLVLVLVLVGTAMLFLSGALQWSSAGGGLTERNNDYYTAVTAAEAATEKVIAQMSKDFQEGGHRQVESNWTVGFYQTLVPQRTESPHWANFEFTDTNGVVDRVTVERGEKGFGPLNWKYSGFTGNTTTYRIISKARLKGWGTDAIGTVKQEVQVAEIPLFEFGAFYNLPMEVDYTQHDLTLNGPVHSNTNAYFGPSVDLTFQDHVTSAGGIFHRRYSSGILLSLLTGTVTYGGASDANALSLNLPLGTNNTPELLHKIIEIPPGVESPQSLLGQQRFYNKADLIILVSDAGATAMSGYTNGFQPFSTAEYDAIIKPFVSTNAKLWDPRQLRYYHLTEIDIAGLEAKYSAVRNKIATDPKIIYVADTRYTNSLADVDAAAVRVVNGRRLRNGVGLTLATMNPLYVKGDFNTQSPERAALVCDAITVLSESWDDNYLLNNVPLLNSLLPSFALIQGATINAGIITGIVPTGSGNYSGALENVITLLENWSLTTGFRFNGSLAVLYGSQWADRSYNVALQFALPPLLRTLSHDTNFKLENKLPHGTPQLRTLIRSDWSIAQAN